MTGGDADDARVLGILRGASISPRDPDVALAELLIEVGQADKAGVLGALQRLARDANRD